MPEIERKFVQFELERMIDNSIKNGIDQKHEKIHYMELVIQAMSSGRRYNDLQDALTTNAAAYDKLQITSSNAGMVAGEIKRTYFRGNSENLLINGLARDDSRILASFLHDRLAELGAAP